MILRRVIAHFRKQEWTAIAIDFVIVVAGVFVGLQVANWNEARVDRQSERAYLLALRDDFAVISSELEDDAAQFASIAEKMKFLLDQSRLPEPDASNAELNAAIAAMISMEGTPMVSSTYEAITGSGDLEIIRSKKVKDAVTAFFGRAEVVRLVEGTHEMQLVDIFQPYIIANLDYPAMLDQTRGLTPPEGFAPERIEAVLQTDAFRNVVAVKWDITTDIRNVILGALERAKAVTAALDEELETE